MKTIKIVNEFLFPFTPSDKKVLICQPCEFPLSLTAAGDWPSVSKGHIFGMLWNWSRVGGRNVDEYEQNTLHLCMKFSKNKNILKALQ